MGLKDYFTDKMLERQLKSLPENQQEIFKELFKQNPEFFSTLSKEIKQRKKDGQDEMLATMAVMKKYEGKMRSLMQNLR